MGSDVPDELRAAVAHVRASVTSTCLIHERDAGFRHQVDYIISRKHGGPSSLDNLALACVLCNRYKGVDVAAIDSAMRQPVLLFNPRQDRWSDHFRVVGATIEPLSPVGVATSRLLQMNTTERITEPLLLQELFIPALNETVRCAPNRSASVPPIKAPNMYP